MSIPAELRYAVRARASFACEYCGVSEIDAGGELTIDHFQPRRHGGDDHPSNLIYCCSRCNGYKADYFPAQPGDRQLWNPRMETLAAHFAAMDDGILHPHTDVGLFTLQRLRLNRPQLIAYRLRHRQRSERTRLLEQYRDLLDILERLHRQQVTALAEQRRLLAEQRALIELLLKREG